MKGIEDRRRKIDSIDAHLTRLLNRRAKLAIEIRVLKKRRGLPSYSPAREREILSRACRTNGGPLDERALSRLFGLILRESRRARAAKAESREARKSQS